MPSLDELCGNLGKGSRYQGYRLEMGGRGVKACGLFSCHGHDITFFFSSNQLASVLYSYGKVLDQKTASPLLGVDRFEPHCLPGEWRDATRTRILLATLVKDFFIGV